MIMNSENTVGQHVHRIAAAGLRLSRCAFCNVHTSDTRTRAAEWTGEGGSQCYCEYERADWCVRVADSEFSQNFFEENDDL